MQTTNAAFGGSYDDSMENRNEPSPEIELPPKATRRIIPPSYKARILKEYDSLDTKGKGALLRREGLYTSHISSWRKAFGANADASLAKARGPRPKPGNSKIKSLEKENQRLAKELERSRRVIEVQGKLSALLEELSLTSADGKEQPNS